MWWWNAGWEGWGYFAPLMMIACMGMMALMMFFMCGRHRRSGDILERRFERGEINRGEYEEGRRILGQ